MQVNRELMELIVSLQQKMEEENAGEQNAEDGLNGKSSEEESVEMDGRVAPELENHDGEGDIIEGPTLSVDELNKTESGKHDSRANSDGDVLNSAVTGDNGTLDTSSLTDSEPPCKRQRTEKSA